MTLPRGYKPETQISDSNKNTDKNENKKITDSTQQQLLMKQLKKQLKKLNMLKKSSCRRLFKYRRIIRTQRTS